MLLAVPLGVGTAAFLSEIAPGWLRRIASFLVEMLAAIPSVVYGFWGIFVLAPHLQTLITWLGGPNTGGFGIFPAGIILAIMIVPYVTAVSYDVCLAVPRSQREAALALGATRWQMIWSAVLPYARPGIVGACFLALGRALGETMAVTMLIGNKPFMPERVQDFLDPDKTIFALGNTIASVIANEFTEAAYDLYLSALTALGLVLLLVTIVVNSLARLLIRRVGRIRAWPALSERLRAFRGKIFRAGPTPLPVAIDFRTHARRVRVIDWLMTGVLGACVVATVGPLFFILSYLIQRGFGALSWELFTSLPKAVGEPGGGMVHALVGSAMLVGLATLWAVPIGLLAAIYLAEYRTGRLTHTVRFVGELLAGVPSIVVGIFAYNVLVKPPGPILAPVFQVLQLDRITGHFSGWAGAFALGLMMIPIVMRASEESLKLVPQSIRNASYALGATQWQTVGRVLLPAALPAIITGVFLAVARVGGETAPLLLTASTSRFFPTSPNDFTPSVPLFIFTYAVSPFPDWHRQAWAAALVLLVVVMLLNFGIRFLTGRRLVSASRAD
jgi:phosphate transport system permease protein